MQANIQLEGKYKTQEEEGREAIEGTTQHTHMLQTRHASSAALRLYIFELYRDRARK
jgi:ABC-type Fe3+-hydroxamate transport system substrate-binding protein